MAMNKLPVLVLLQLIMVVSIPQKLSIIDARSLPFISHQANSKAFATLGVVCKCCDGTEGACTSTWKDSCSNLQCSPWKSAH